MSETATDPAELERQLDGQLLGLGALALEMHQSGELADGSGYQLRSSCAALMRLAAEAAETERGLERARD